MSIISNTPNAILLEGAELLMPLFSEHGFIFAPLGAGMSSGGRFACAAFRRGKRSLQLHFRDSLGMVTYHLGPDSISHEEYMCSVLGKPGLSRYPGFSSDPVAGFRDLRDDLRDHCSEFLEGTDELFRLRIEDARSRWANRPKLPV